VDATRRPSPNLHDGHGPAPPPETPSIGGVTRVQPDGTDSCGFHQFSCASIHVDDGVMYELHAIDGAGAVLGVYVGIGS
jgi:hypothetical protein